ncbi:MAG: hypothetical protein ACRDIB_16505, partial [Ardenticatenaceae bacterium]
MSGVQAIRGGLNVHVELESADTNVGTITSPVVFSGNLSTVNALFDPIAAGQTTLSLTQPAGFSTPSNGPQQITVTVTAPDINLADTTVGRDLQDGQGVSLQSAPPAPVDVVLTIADDTIATITANPAIEGGSTVTFPSVTGTFVGTLYIQGRAEGSTTITVQATGYNDRIANVVVTPSGFEIATSSFSTTTFAANTNVTVRARRLATGTLAVSSVQAVRGGLTVEVELESSDTSVGTITSPVVFSGNQSVLNASFDPIGAGETTLTLTQPAGFSVPSNGPQQITATVTAPNITLNDTTVGRDLQDGQNITLQSAPPAPVDVVVTVSSTAIATISSDGTVEGGSTVTFPGVTSTFA